MTQEFDPKKSYLAVKAREKMIAFASFLIRMKEHGATKQGVVKISSFHRPYGGGYLTLTFIVDKGQNEALSDRLQRLFNNLTENALKPLLGEEFERIVKVDLDSLEETRWWYIEEVNMYFQSIEGLEKILVEGKIIPALEVLLPFTFEPIEWWPEGRKAESPDREGIGESMPLRAIFKKWFGSS
jgi:hypothetical protein